MGVYIYNPKPGNKKQNLRNDICENEIWNLSPMKH